MLRLVPNAVLHDPAWALYAERISRPWTIPLISALALTGLWLLSPTRSAAPPEPGVVEITYLGPAGPLAGATGDAVRAFEAESRAAHARDPSQPIYRVVSGQNASNDFTGDPTRFLVGVAGGEPPDVIRFDRFAISEWAARGAFESLDAYLARDADAHVPDAVRPQDYYRPCWAEVVYRDPRTGNSAVCGIPDGLDDRVLYYNKDLLKRAGFVDEKGDARPPRTWEELADMAVRLTERDDPAAPTRITRLGFAPNLGNAWLYMYGFNNGGRFMSDDGTRCTFDDPPVVAALEWMTHVYDALGGAEGVNAFQTGLQSGDLDPFILGKIAMKIDGSWYMNLLEQYGEGLDYAAAPPPVPAARLAAGALPLSWVGGWCHAIPSTARHKEAAWALIRFLASPRAAAIMAESERQLAESAGWAYVPLLRANRVVDEELFARYAEGNPAVPAKMRAVLAVSRSLIDTAAFRPVSVVGQFMWNEQLTATDDALFHKFTPAAALTRATVNSQRELDRALAPPHGVVVRWSVFPWLYGALLLGVGAAVYFWDTRWRGGNPVEGTRGGYFRSQWIGGWLCASPWIVGFVVFTGGPILFSIVVSFCEYDVLNPARFTGAGNYTRMFTDDPLFWKSLGNTLYMAIGVPLGMAASLGIALLLNLRVRGVAVWRTFFYLPSIMPLVASSLLWVWIFNPQGGLLNGLLASVGISGPNWLQDERTSKPALILMGLWGAGGGMIVWLAGLKGINDTYYEAAALDGAGPWARFRHITLPLLSPYVLFNFVMGSIAVLQTFTQAFVMTKGGPVNSTLFFVYYLFNSAFRYLHMGYASAMGWVLFVLVCALTLAQMRWSRRWVHYEGD